MSEPTARRGPDVERRAFGSKPQITTRAAAAEGSPESLTIRGHASVFETWTTLYESKYYVWREIVRRTAFDNAIKEGQDVFALLNHDPNFVIGRSTSGTCRLSTDAEGLAFECDPDPENVVIQSLVVRPMARKDLDRCSFAFTIRSGGEVITIREENGVTIEERELTDLDLYDVSVVTYPQYREAMCEMAERGQSREAELRRRATAEIRRREMDARRRSLRLWY